MPFVKLDCGILNSTLWFEREAREVFITALLMAEPLELTESTPQINVDSLEDTGWMVPPGWYGFVPAAGIGIIHRARVDEPSGIEALRLLGSPEINSRSPEFDGRRLVRIDGGYLVLNYMKYRERDYTSAERSRRYRKRVASRRDVTPTHRDITQAEAEAEAEVEEKREKSGRGRTPRASEKAGAFCEWYADTHERLFGIGYMGTNLDYQKALELCGKFTDQQLRDAALVWFGDEDKFASEGTRSIPKFASRVSGYLQTIKAKGLAS